MGRWRAQGRSFVISGQLPLVGVIFQRQLLGLSIFGRSQFFNRGTEVLKPFQVIAVVFMILVLFSLNKAEKGSTNPGSETRTASMLSVPDFEANEQPEEIASEVIIIQDGQVCEDGRCPLIREAVKAVAKPAVNTVRALADVVRGDCPCGPDCQCYQVQDSAVVSSSYQYSSTPNYRTYVAGQPLRNVVRCQPVRSVLRRFFRGR